MQPGCHIPPRPCDIQAPLQKYYQTQQTGQEISARKPASTKISVQSYTKIVELNLV